MVTTPRAVALASGTFNLFVFDPICDHFTSVPVVPTVSSCAAVVCPLMLVIPLPPATLRSTVPGVGRVIVTEESSLVMSVIASGSPLMMTSAPLSIVTPAIQ